MNDAEELARLRARVTELEAQLTEAESPAASEVRPRGSRWRSFTAGLLIVVACLLAPLSVASVWASRQISDTDQYVQTVAPVIDDPGVQKAIANEVTAAIMENLDVRGLTTDALQTVAQQPNMPPRAAAALPALAIPLTKGIESFTRSQATTLVASPQFAKVWDSVNRAAHNQVVNLLEGNRGGALSAQGDNITLNLGPIIAEVKDRLVAQGFSLAERIPTIDRSFVLVQSGAITNAQRFYTVLNALGAWLPFIALAFLAAGVYLARDRRSALLKGSLGVAGAMLLLGASLTLARILYVETTPGGLLTADSAGNVFETLVRFLRDGVRTTGVLALVVALAAFLSGPSSASVRTRATLRHGIGSLRGGAESAGLNTGRFGAWTYTHKRGLRLGAFFAGGLVLVFSSQPTVGTVVTIALVVLLALVAIEFLGRPPEPGAAAVGVHVPQQVTRTGTPPGGPSAPGQPESGKPLEQTGTGTGRQP